MDAFAISVTNGLALKSAVRKQALRIALAFGISQAVMPLLGYFLGSFFEAFIKSYSHWVALVFLGFVGGKMLFDGIRENFLLARNAPDDTNSQKSDALPLWSLIMQAIATSIDAFVVGVSFVAVGITGALVFAAAGIIGSVTFVFCFFGVFLGRKFGSLLGSKAKIVGGIILIGIGVFAFLENTILK